MKDFSAEEKEKLPMATAYRFYEKIKGAWQIKEVWQLTGGGVKSGVYRMVEDSETYAVVVGSRMNGVVGCFAPILKDGKPSKLSDHVDTTDAQFAWNNRFFKSPIIQNLIAPPTVEIQDT